MHYLYLPCPGQIGPAQAACFHRPNLGPTLSNNGVVAGISRYRGTSPWCGTRLCLRSSGLSSSGFS